MHGQGKKALVVEDNHFHQKMVATLLESLGYTVFTAADGDTGLEVVNSEHDLELIVTDIFMPKKEGIGFIRAVKSRHLQAKIIVVTGAVNFSVISDTAMLFGADLIFKKPIDIDDFTEKLNQLVAVS